MRRSRISPYLIAALSAGLALPSLAHAGNGVVTRTGDELRLTFTDAADSLIASTIGDPETGSIRLDENSGAGTTVTASGSTGCTPSGEALVCPRSHNGIALQRLVVDFNGGDDYSEFPAPPASLNITYEQNGGAGRDTLWGTERNDVIDGGPGPDEILGFRGRDILRGGSGDDTLEGYQGNDDYFGGDGFDIVYMSNPDFATQGVHVTLDDLANDGVDSGNEGDNVHTDVEDVFGTGFDDRLIGDDSSNLLSGGGGNDFLDGGGGGDVLDAGSGDDVLLARDGVPERILCGNGTDQLTADDVDEHEGCENVSASPEQQPDLDGDGVSRPADCNDRDAAIRPGAPEIADNGVDDDCTGGDATNLDRDGDGSPRPFDCDDGNAAVRPGGLEVLGNRLDEDCSGRANPFEQILSGVPSGFARRGGRVSVLVLGVRDLVKGTTVELRCSGRGCPFARKTRLVRRNTALLNLRALVRRARLRAGATLEVRITRPGAIGKIVRFPIPRRGLPVSRVLCLKPDERKAQPC